MLSGCVSLGLGGIGMIVPGLPTVVFWIVSAWCFGKSCPALQRWIYNRPRVGPMIEMYNEKHMMTAQSKRRALIGMWFGMSLSILILLLTAKPLWIPSIVAGCGAAVTWYILNRVATANAST
ncbi:MAG: YbaN family protein [Phycisphaeraceae bacterium]|nr:YbaN family protein [Phycisphaeraceae bacterium]